ncbi:MAG: hypothetical protein JW867_01705 [Candidatus Omnitrophica bacterium]|nr:hypothetical protein [Candidatus Omnitrophota bacterium]
MNTEFFDPINIIIPKEQIFKRLGYDSKKTKISSRQLQENEEIIYEAASLLALKGSALRLKIKKISGAKLMLSEGISFESRLAVRILKGCQEALLMGVTAGQAVIEEIKRLSQKDLSRAVIYDAVASESTDACFGWIENYYHSQLSRESRKLTGKRISCGYADFKLEYQKVIYRALNMKSLGINLTKSMILVPEKSATGLTGIITLR